MEKKMYSLVLSALVTVGVLSGCEIDVNELVSNSSETENSSLVSYSDTQITESKEFDTDIDIETDTDTDTVSQVLFDTSVYKQKYISGAGTVDVIEDAKGNSKVVGTLDCGESVFIIKNVVTDTSDEKEEISFIYSETLGNFGYVKNINLVDMISEISYGEVYYVTSDDSPFYSDEYGTSLVENLSKNDMVTVLAKLSSGLWRVSEKSDKIGYISTGLLSEEKIIDKITSSRTESKSASRTESKTSSMNESTIDSENETKTESKEESKIESKAESKTEPSVLIGEGDPPTSNYTVYVVDVDLGYLALRSEPNSNSNSTIGNLYYGEYVDVIDTSGEYWYIYAPTLGMYGYVSGNSDYLYPASY